MAGYQSVDDADPIRVEILRALVARFGGVTPVPAGDAFEIARGHRIGPAALTHRRQRDELPWPRELEVRDGARYLVPLPTLADCLVGVGVKGDAPRRRRRGRPALRIAGGAA